MGIGMCFARAYALGLYHQRCGANLGLPYTRFAHAACHVAPASIPMPASSFGFSWTTISNYAVTINSDNPPQIAPFLTSPQEDLFPYINQGTIDTSGGHHDAGDYSKYTINSASLVHYLMFEVDSLPGVASLDNLGIAESGDGISDVMQEAKWESDYLAKLQDADGGFYFLVYPVDREYESNVTPENGDPQVVWPKDHLCYGGRRGGAGAMRFLALVQEDLSCHCRALFAKSPVGLEFSHQRHCKIWETRRLPENHRLRR